MKKFAPIFVLMLVSGSASTAIAQLKASDTPAAVDDVSHYIDVMEKYLYVIDHVARVSENPTNAGIAGVLGASDLMKNKPQDAIDYFTKLLPEVKNEAVRRAIRLQLADLYKKTDQPDKSLEQLKELIIAAPGTTSRSARTAPPEDGTSGRTTGPARTPSGRQ
jgi:thioredoxin-like negative regulator of GroEL